jgi:hypothetical protein
MRLNAIAHVRPHAIAAVISRNNLHPGQPLLPRAATTIPANANGSAKIVWLNFTNSPHFRTLLRGRDNRDEGTPPL